MSASTAYSSKAKHILLHQQHLSQSRRHEQIRLSFDSADHWPGHYRTAILTSAVLLQFTSMHTPEEDKTKPTASQSRDERQWYATNAVLGSYLHPKQL